MSLLISGCKTLGPAPDMSIKVERQLHDMRILGDMDCGSAQRGTIRWYHKIPC